MDARTAEKGREDLARSSAEPSLFARLRRRPFVVAGIAILCLIVIAGVVVWWLNARQYESTDDAFIDARTVSISSQVNGAIVDVSVTDNQLVSARTPLVRIDDRDYRAAFNQAIAQVHQAQANISNIDAQIDAQQAGSIKRRSR